MSNLPDANVPAGLLKEWLRQLPEPVIPDAFYSAAIAVEDEQSALAVARQLPPVNQAILRELAALAAEISAPENVDVTRMNLYVWR